MTDPYRGHVDFDAEEIAWQWLDSAIEHTWDDPELAYDLALITWRSAKHRGFSDVVRAADAYLAVIR